MNAQFVEGRVVTRLNCQEVVLRVTHQQPAPLEMPRDTFTERMHQPI